MSFKIAKPENHMSGGARFYAKPRLGEKGENNKSDRYK